MANGIWASLRVKIGCVVELEFTTSHGFIKVLFNQKDYEDDGTDTQLVTQKKTQEDRTIEQYITYPILVGLYFSILKFLGGCYNTAVVLLHFYDVYAFLRLSTMSCQPSSLEAIDREATVGCCSRSELPGVGCRGARPNSELRAKTVAERQIE